MVQRNGRHFAGAQFDGLELNFGQTIFDGCNVDFYDASLSRASLWFNGSWFRGTGVIFKGLRTVRTSVDLSGTIFSESDVSFEGSELSNATLNFSGATFRSTGVGLPVVVREGTELRFTGSRLESGRMDFDSARLEGGIVDFSDARFEGMSVDFSGASIHTFRPIFNWTTVPEGLTLPAAHDRPDPSAPSPRVGAAGVDAQSDLP